MLVVGSCPKGIAWSDRAYGIDQAHRLAECSNAGLCNRRSGDCECFRGYTGIACQRSKILEFEKNVL